MKFKFYVFVIFLFQFFFITFTGFAAIVQTGQRPVSVAFSQQIPARAIRAAFNDPVALTASLSTSGVFAAVANSGDNTISVYQVDTTTAAFTLFGVFPVGSNPQSVAFSPEISGNFFIATANAGDNTVSVYMFNATTQSLTLVATPKTGKHPQSIAFSSLVSGKVFAAVANSGDNTVTIYKVNTSTGAFKKIATRFTGRHPVCVAFSPEISGRLFVAATNSKDSTLSLFKLSKMGEFRKIETRSTGKHPVSVAFSPHVLGKLLVVTANYKGDSLSIYNVNPTKGNFKLIDTQTMKKNPIGVAFSYAGGDAVFFAVANEGNNTIVLATISLSSTVSSPRDLKGFRSFDGNVLTWKAPNKGDPVSSYRIFRNQFNHLIGEVPSDHPLTFRDPNANPCKPNTYYVVSVNAAGDVSLPAKVVICPLSPFK